MLVRNEGIERKLLEQIKSSFVADDVTRHATIHMSDMLNPRKGLLARTVPLRATDDESLLFATGRSYEDLVGRLGQLQPGEERMFLGFTYRPDFRWGGLIPTEFKSRRRNLAKEGTEEEEYQSYINQLRAYCAADESLLGRLIILSTLQGQDTRDPKKRTTAVIRVYDAIFTEEELQAERDNLGARLVLFKAALAGAEAGESVQEYLAPVPLCAPAWLCGKRTKVVDAPEFCKQCGKAVKHGPAHEHRSVAGAILDEKAHWEYQPLCKWWSVCSPWLVDPARGA